MKSAQLQIRVSPAQKQALASAARAAGMDVSTWVLSKALGSPRTQFLQKVGEVTEENRKFALADLADFFNGLNKDQFLEAISLPWDQPVGSYLSNYIAAMIELKAHNLEVPAPAWLMQIPHLDAPYFGTELVGLKLYLLRNSPPPFKARNIYIDTTLEGRV